MHNLYWQPIEPQDEQTLWAYQNIYSTTPPEQIEFIESVDNLAGISYQTILLDMQKWDHYWRQDRCNYVPACLEDFPRNCCNTENDYQAEIAMHRQKTERWQQQLKTDTRVPAVCFENALSGGLLRIRQGRHRIAYLRNLKLPVFAAAIPVALIKHFKKHNLIVSCSKRSSPI